MLVKDNGSYFYDYQPKIKTWHADKERLKKQTLLPKLRLNKKVYRHT